MSEKPADTAPLAPVLADCPRCLKKGTLCVCDSLRELSTRHHVLILQHPQEPDKELGSARLAHLSLPNSTLKVGLSWPNLAKALGRPAQPGKWGVLYLGSGVKTEGSTAPAASAKPNAASAAEGAIAKKAPAKPRLRWVSKKGEPLSLKESNEITAGLEGIIVLDGTWSQAKALWWRNAWLLKLRRAILVPAKPSLYRELRKEPRRECLSTIESIADSLEALGEKPEAGEALRALFGKLLDRKRALGSGRPRR